MTTVPKTIPRMVTFIETRQLGMAWFIAVVLGAFVISSNASITPARVIVPAAIMIVYGVFVFNRWSALFATASESYKLSIIAQLADSMYFMGFIWTLWALIDSFVVHQIDTADAIFRSFGYALVTTATGMFCRLMILQFKYTAAEQSQGAQESVEDLLLKFSASLQATRQGLTDWHATLTTASNANSELIGAMEKARGEITKTMEAATSNYLAMLGTTVASLQRHVDETKEGINVAIHDGIAEGLRDFGQQVATNLDQIREGTSGLVTTLKRTNTGLGKSIGDLTTKVSDAVQQFNTATDGFASATRRVIDNMDGASSKLAGNAARFENIIDKTGDVISAATQTMAHDLAGLSEDIKREIKLGLDGIVVTPRVPLVVDDTVLNSAMSPVREHLNRISTQTSGILQTLNTDIAKASSTRDLTEHVDQAVAGAVSSISDHLNTLQTDLERPVWGRFFSKR
jgi:hypothetical protein